MRCSTHPEVEALGVCRVCGRGLCADCGVEVKDLIVCRNRCEDRAAAIDMFVGRQSDRYWALTGYACLLLAGLCLLWGVFAADLYTLLLGLIFGVWSFALHRIIARRFSRRTIANQSPSVRKSPTKKVLLAVAGAVVIFGLFLAGSWIYYVKLNSFEKTRDVQVSAPLASLEVTSRLGRVSYIYGEWNTGTKLTDVANVALFSGFAPEMRAEAARYSVGPPDGEMDGGKYWNRELGKVLLQPASEESDDRWKTFGIFRNCTLEKLVVDEATCEQLRRLLPAEGSSVLVQLLADDGGLWFTASDSSCGPVEFLAPRRDLR